MHHKSLSKKKKKNTYLGLVLDNKTLSWNLKPPRNLYMVLFYKLLTNRYFLGITPSNPEFLMGPNQIWSGVNLIKGSALKCLNI